MVDTSETDHSWLGAEESEEGCDLAQIENLLKMSPTERVLALQKAANNLLKIRQVAKRI